MLRIKNEDMKNRIIEDVKMNYNVVLESFEFISKDKVGIYYEENNIFKLSNGDFVFSENWYDIEGDN